MIGDGAATRRQRTVASMPKRSAAGGVVAEHGHAAGERPVFKVSRTRGAEADVHLALAPGAIGPAGKSVTVHAQVLGPWASSQRRVSLVANQEGLGKLFGRFDDAQLFQRLIHHRFRSPLEPLCQRPRRRGDGAAHRTTARVTARRLPRQQRRRPEQASGTNERP